MLVKKFNLSYFLLFIQMLESYDKYSIKHPLMIAFRQYLAWALILEPPQQVQDKTIEGETRVRCTLGLSRSVVGQSVVC